MLELPYMNAPGALCNDDAEEGCASSAPCAPDHKFNPASRGSMGHANGLGSAYCEE